MRRAVSPALLFFLLCASFARAEWRVVSSTNTPAAATAEVAHRHLLAEETKAGRRATMELALFSTKLATLRVIDNPEANDSLDAIMSREKCLAGVNGGYFDPDYAPVGLLLSDGRIVAPLRKARLLSGVVSVVNGRVQVQRTAEFSMKSKPREARQCGPFLVERGKPVAGLNKTRPARRTFVATLGAERAAIGYCSPVTLAQLADVLAMPELKIQRALNLDGGSSSGFWFAGESSVFSIREQKRVRDYLAIVAKP